MMNTSPLFALGTLACLLLLSPVYASGQELSEAQRRERCDNNRKYLEDYDRQIEAVDAKLRFTMTDEELARARAQYDFAENILQKGLNERSKTVREEQVAKLEELSTLYEFDEKKYCPLGLGTYHSDCMAHLAEQVRRRVVAAEQANPQKKELHEQRTQLQAKRAVHQDRLQELGCDQTSGPQKGGCEGFAGTWKTTFGTMTFARRGNQIISSYDFDGGSIRGTISGDGRTLTGTYSEIEAKGTFRFTLAADGKSFSGNWRRTSGTRNPPSGEWLGECTSP